MAFLHNQLLSGEMKSALLSLVPLLHEADPMWCVYGSCALALNGVPGVDVHDVDILLSSGGVRRLLQQLPQARLLADDRPGSRFRSLHARVYIGNVEIDLSGDLQLLTQGKWSPVQVEHVCLTDGIRYASLPDCVRLLRQFGRPKDFTRLELVDAACSQGLCAWPASHPGKP